MPICVGTFEVMSQFSVQRSSLFPLSFVCETFLFHLHDFMTSEFDSLFKILDKDSSASHQELFWFDNLETQCEVCFSFGLENSSFVYFNTHNSHASGA